MLVQLCLSSRRVWGSPGGAMQSPMLKHPECRGVSIHLQAKQAPQPCHNPWESHPRPPQQQGLATCRAHKHCPRDAPSYSLETREAGASGPAPTPCTCSQGHPTVQCQTGLSAKPCLPGLHLPIPKTSSPTFPCHCTQRYQSTKTMEAPSGTPFLGGF